MELTFSPGTYFSIGTVSVFRHRDRDSWLIFADGQPHPLELTKRQVTELIYALGATRELEEGAFIAAIREQIRAVEAAQAAFEDER